MAFVFRERREHRVYETLLKMVPKLEERLMTASEEEVAMVSELASINQPFNPSYSHVAFSYKRGLQVPDQMIPRASRVWSSTGSHPADSLCPLRLDGTSRWIAASTTRSLVLCSVQLALIGPTPSCVFLLLHPLTTTVF
jgi:hypothetical protein